MTAPAKNTGFARAAFPCLRGRHTSYRAKGKIFWPTYAHAVTCAFQSENVYWEEISLRILGQIYRLLDWALRTSFPLRKILTGNVFGV